MKVVAHGSHLVLKLIPKKQQESKVGILIVPGGENDDTNLYEVISTSNESLEGKVVFMKAYAIPLKIDGETFYIVDEKDVCAVIHE